MRQRLCAMVLRPRWLRVEGAEDLTMEHPNVQRSTLNGKFASSLRRLQGQMNFQFTHPHFLWLLIPAIAWVAWLTGKSDAGISKWRKWTTFCDLRLSFAPKERDSPGRTEMLPLVRVLGSH